MLIPTGAEQPTTPTQLAQETPGSDQLNPTAPAANTTPSGDGSTTGSLAQALAHRLSSPRIRIAAAALLFIGGAALALIASSAHSADSSASPAGVAGAGQSVPAIPQSGPEIRHLTPVEAGRIPAEPPAPMPADPENTVQPGLAGLAPVDPPSSLPESVATPAENFRSTSPAITPSYALALEGSFAGPLIPGSAAATVVSVHNRLEAAATAPALVTVQLPPQLSPRDLPAGCELAGHGVRCLLTVIPGEGEARITIPVLVDEAAPPNADIAATVTMNGASEQTVKIYDAIADKPRNGLAASLQGLQPTEKENSGSVRAATPDIASWQLPQTENGQKIDYAAEPATAAPPPAADAVLLTEVPSDPVSAGSEVTIGVRASEERPDAAIVLELPSHAKPGKLPADCQADGRSIRCQGDKATIGVLVDPQTSAGAILADGWLTLVDPSDPTSANNTQQVTLRVGASQTNLAVSVEKAPAAIVPGESATLLAKVHNQGPASTAVPVAVLVELPAGVSVAKPPADCAATDAADTFACHLAAPLAASQERELEFALAVDPAAAAQTDLGPARIAATVDSETDEADNSADIVIASDVQQWDLALTAQPPATVTPGSQAAIGVRLHNAGPSVTGGETEFSVKVPNGMVAAAEQPAGCVAATARIQCRIAEPVSVNDDRIVAVNAVLNPSMNAGERVHGSVILTSSDASSAGDNHEFELAASAPIADVAAAVVAPDHPAPGAVAAVVVRVTNNGPSRVRDAGEVQFRLPDHTELAGELPMGCERADDGVQCQVRSGLAKDQTQELAIPIRADATVPANAAITGGLVVVDSGHDPVAANNETLVAYLLGESVFVLDAEVTPVLRPIVPGESAQLNAQVTNKGPSPVAGTQVVTFAPPEHAALTGAPAGCELRADAVQCAINDGMAPGESRQFAIQAVIASGAPPNVDLCCGSAVTSSLSRGYTLRTGVRQVTAELIVVTPPPVAPGSAGELAVTVRNTGPSDATEPSVLEIEMPEHVSMLASGDCGDRCAVPAIRAGESAQLHVRFAIAEDVDFSSTLRRGQIHVRELGSVDVTRDFEIVTAPRLASDLSVTINHVDQPVAPGETDHVQVVVVNQGPAKVTSPTRLEVTLPAHTRPSQPVAGCAVAGDDLACDIATIGNGEQITIEIAVAVDPAAGGPRSLGAVQALVRNPGDPQLSNNVVGTQVATTAPVARLGVELTVPPAMPPGGAGTLTATVTNLGPSQLAESDTVTMQIPAGLNTAAGPDLPLGCVRHGDELACLVPAGLVPAAVGQTPPSSLPLDTQNSTAQFPIPIQAALDTSAGSQLSVTAVVADGATVAEPDGAAGSDTMGVVSTAAIAVAPAQAQLTMASELADDSSGTGASLVVTVRNAGPSRASGVALGMPVPDGVRVVASAAGGCNITGSMLSCALPEVPPHRGVQLRFAVVPTSKSNGESVTARLWVAATGSDQLTNDVVIPVRAPKRASKEVDTTAPHSATTPWGYAIGVVGALAVAGGVLAIAAGVRGRGKRRGFAR